jgi:hypothetical protein
MRLFLGDHGAADGHDGGDDAVALRPQGVDPVD